MELLRQDVLTINSKQDSMNKVIGSMQTAVTAFSQQLSAITDILKTMSTNEPSTSIPPVVCTNNTSPEPTIEIAPSTSK